jgi:hypothetical protein
MKMFLCIAMALVFMFFVVPSMAADVCPLKTVLPEADTIIVQMTNSELSEVRGGLVWAIKNIYIHEPPVSNPVKAKAISTGSGQVNNVSINTGTDSLKYNSQTNGGYGFRKLIITFQPLQVVEQDPAP